MTCLKELDEAGHDAALDDLLDRWIFLFREQLAKAGGCIELALRLIAENTSNHFIGQLNSKKR